MGKQIIPAISDADLSALNKRIQVVGRDRSGKLRFRKKRDPRDEAFDFYDEFCGKANRLVPIATIETWHTCGTTMGVNNFMPTFAEVAAQIPREHLDRVAAFETTYDGKDEWKSDLESDGWDYHKGKTVLYANA
jgi:hypothetical protein